MRFERRAEPSLLGLHRQELVTNRLDDLGDFASQFGVRRFDDGAEFEHLGVTVAQSPQELCFCAVQGRDLRLKLLNEGIRQDLWKGVQRP